MNAFIVFAAIIAAVSAVPAYSGYGYSAPMVLAGHGYAAQPLYSGYSSQYRTMNFAPVAVAAPFITKSYAAAPIVAAPALIGGYGLGYAAKGYGHGLGHY